MQTCRLIVGGSFFLPRGSSDPTQDIAFLRNTVAVQNFAARLHTLCSVPVGRRLKYEGWSILSFAGIDGEKKEAGCKSTGHALCLRQPGAVGWEGICFAPGNYIIVSTGVFLNGNCNKVKRFLFALSFLLPLCLHQGKSKRCTSFRFPPSTSLWFRSFRK